MARSFKYHRPRGVVTAGASEPNALMEIGEGGRRDANTRATMVELYDGLTASSQNRWPSLAFDLGAVNALPHRSSSPASTTRPSCGRRASGKRCTSR
jgi:sarcosine oxidase subunit alpha